MIEYKKGDMFEADPQGSLFLHACNCQGVWGSGIARQFKESFPVAYRKYKKYCEDNSVMKTGGNYPTGKYQFLRDSPKGSNEFYNIINIFTSWNYGKRKDSPSTILHNTGQALYSLFRDAIFDPWQLGFREQGYVQIHSPKINSGYFDVPWEHTESLIEYEISRLIGGNDLIHWTVWEL